MVRPNSIVMFERLYLGSWLLGLVPLAINWNETKLLIQQDPSATQFGAVFMTNIVVGTLVFSSLITLLLWYFAARQRSVVAKWVVVACFVLTLLGIPGIISVLTSGQVLSAALAVGVFALHAGAIFMLFRPDAREWFGELKGPPNDPRVGDTFQ